MKRVLFILAILSFNFVSCEKDNPVPADDLIPRKDIVLTKAQSEFVRSNNGFALDLFKRVSQKENGRSLLISPLSVTIDFGMVNNGAAGQTQKEIYETLGYGEGSVEGLNDFCHTMMEQSAAVDPSTTMEIANAAVVNKLYPGLKDSFTNKVKSIYGAEVMYKDFAKEDIKKLINDWCDRKTHGMIPELLKEPVGADSYAHFLNAVYFKGIWASKFRKEDTKKESFTCEDGSKTTVKMMHQKDRFDYGGIPGLCSAVGLPYGNGAYLMTLLLPAEGKSLSDLVNGLDADTWSRLLMSGVEVDVKIPSFETEYFVSLKNVLKGMGIVTAFSGDADFSSMSSASGLYISDVLHKAKIKVDEDGTEAAAVTDIVVDGALAPGYTPPTREFHADRPFLYVITEISTGAIFFIGKYTGK